MDRRTFLKLTTVSLAGLSPLAKLELLHAKGISAEQLGTSAPAKGFVLPRSEAITISLSDLFKVGPGPSSSHTIAPLRIAADFLQALENLPTETIRPAQALEVRLYGSLSATGRGHHTDRAIIAGLLGEKPETCNTSLMDALGDTTKSYSATIQGKKFTIHHGMIVWDVVEHNLPFANTMVMRLLAADGSSLFEREYYSTGGGFFQWKGQPPAQRGKPLYQYNSMESFRRILTDHGKTLDEVMLANEMAIMGVDAATVMTRLDLIIATMENSVKQGLAEEGLIPAPFEFHRKAKLIYEKSLGEESASRFMKQLSSYALAVSEGNACGRLAVTAPTLGSAGTMPAVLHMMKHHLNMPQEALRSGLLAGGLVGFLCKTNASVAGAEVGCQGEIGVASAMAAAMLAHASGADIDTTEVAATMALEHHLGMSCDPVGGFVLIPCIERNAFGAVKAYNSYLIASTELTSQHWEDLDRVIAAMLQTGQALPAAFRETGAGGLGSSMVNC
ncbi:MAG: L-serine ammonia-lyase [Deltaproteobacteria bacterium]|nr:L-serine ammonia-lyase [Deltaproteobacteria bacterium]